jgi:hypothetical protein
MPAVTYIVSAFDRPRFLRGCLASLQVQTDPDFEVMVACNSPDPGMQLVQRDIVEPFDHRFRFCDTDVMNAGPEGSPAWDCYWSAEWVVGNRAKGEYICLPSDDSYYVPIFQEAMLAKARAENLGLVYCDMLYDRRMCGKYGVLEVHPIVDFIDKTGFLVRRDAWIGFPAKNTIELGPSKCDGEMIEELVRRGVRHGKVEEVLVVHN